MPTSFFAVPVASQAGLRIIETRYSPFHVLPPHDHELASMSLVFAGGQEERVGQRRLECTKTNVVFKPAEISHSDHVGGAGMHGLFVELPADTLIQLVSAGIDPHDVACHSNTTIAFLTRRVASELRHRQCGYELVVEGLLFELFGALARNAPSVTPHVQPWLARAREYVEAHFRDSLSLSQVAQAVGVHSSHLAQQFRKHFGHSIGQHVRYLRVEYARDALLMPERSLGEIALASGFADQSHFTRLFRQHVGMPPAEYRRTHALQYKRKSASVNVL